MKVLFFLLGLFLIISCQAKPQYYQEKIYSHKEVAKLYIAEGRYADALRELELAQQTLLRPQFCSNLGDLQKLDPEERQKICDPEVYNLFGVVYMAKKDYTKAEDYFKSALMLDPDFSEAYTNLGSLRMMQEKYQEAISYFEKALSNPLYPRAYIALANMGWCYYKLKDKDKALNILHQAIKENALATKPLIYIALIYLKEGDLDSAEFYLKRVLKNERSSLEARYYLGEVFFEKGKYELAKEIWESITQIAPDSEWANLSEDKLYLLRRLQSSSHKETLKPNL